MNQLTTLDAGFLHAEDADRNANLAIGGLAIIDGPVPDYDSLVAAFATRISRCPRFAQRLRTHRFDLGAPQWVDDPTFDLMNHVKRIGVPRPGDEQAMLSVVADLMAFRLDRRRPLWEIWILDGLSDNRWAMLTKIHHCMADGVAATHMLAGLCDEGVGDSFASRVGAAKASPARDTVGVPLNPLKLISGLWNTSTAITAAAARAAQGAAALAARLLDSAPATGLNGPLSSRRRYSSARVSLDDMATVCETFGVTVNDVALAAVTESYRAMLVRRGETPLPDSLRTLVPVSLRTPDALDQTDNRVSLMLPYLPVEEENAVRRLRAVHARLDRTKSDGEREAGSAIMSLASHVPFPLTAWTVRLLTRLPQRGVATLATNVPGPKKPLHILGHELLAVFPVPPMAMQLRTGVAMLSYADHLSFGILADYEAVPDAHELAHGIEVAVARLVARSKSRKPASERHGLALVHSA